MKEWEEENPKHSWWMINLAACGLYWFVSGWDFLCAACCKNTGCLRKTKLALTQISSDADIEAELLVCGFHFVLVLSFQYLIVLPCIEKPFEDFWRSYWVKQSRWIAEFVKQQLHFIFITFLLISDGILIKARLQGQPIDFRTLINPSGFALRWLIFTLKNTTF